MLAFHVVLAALAAAVGLVFNGYILLVLLWQRRSSSQTANHLLLLHLAVVDTLFCFLVLLGNTPLGALAYQASLGLAGHLSPDAFADSVAPFGSVQAVLWTVLPIVLVWTICGLSCDRYAAICVPLSYAKLVSSRRAALFIVLSWSLALCLAAGPFVGICSYDFSPARSSFAIACPASAGSAQLVFALIFATLAVLLPVSIVFVCNTHVLMIARYQRHRIVAAIYEITMRAAATAVSSKTSPVTGQATMTLPPKTRQSGDALLTLLLASYFFMVTPSYAVFVVESFTSTSVRASLVSTATVLLTLIPSVNAYVYGVKSRLVRQTFKRLLQRYLYKQQASIEIDRRLSLRSQSSLRAAMGWHSFLASSVNIGSPIQHQRTRRYSAPMMLGSRLESQETLAEPGARLMASRRLSLHSLVLQPSPAVSDLEASFSEESSHSISGLLRPQPSVVTSLKNLDVDRRSNFLQVDHGAYKPHKKLLSPIAEVSFVAPLDGYA